MGRAACVAVMVVVLVACGGGDGDAEPRAGDLCRDLYPDGEVIDDVDVFSETPCRPDESESSVTFLGTATDRCADGRILYWNDWAWGYVGEPLHVHENGADKVPPEAEQEACS